MWPFAKRGRDAPRQSNQGYVHPLYIWMSQGNISLEGSEAIFAAVTRISNTLASMPFRLYKGFDEQKDHPLSRLLSYQPRPGMTPFTFMQTMETCRNTAGNCYAFKVPSPVTGLTVALDILDPNKVTPYRDRESGETWYQLRPDSGGEMWVHNREMIHCRHVCTNGLEGISPIKVLTGSLDYDREMKEFSLFQVKGVNSSVVLEFPTSISKEKKKEIIDGFLTNYKASAGSLVVLDSGINHSVINKSPVDSKVLEVEMVTRNRVASVYNMPPHMLGAAQNVSYQSQEQQMLEFLQLTMVAIVTMYEAEFDQKLLTWKDIRDGYHWRADIEAVLKADIQSQAKRNSLAVRGGWLLVNEIRAKDHKKPVPYGDTPMASRDMAPLQYLIEHPEKGATGGGRQ